MNNLTNQLANALNITPEKLLEDAHNYVQQRVYDMLGTNELSQDDLSNQELVAKLRDQLINEFIKDIFNFYRPDKFKRELNEIINELDDVCELYVKQNYNEFYEEVKNNG
jgi:hypothetical protein